MLILGLECSSKSASVAVVKDGCVLGEKFLHSGKTHSQTLMPMLTTLLKELEISVLNIDVIAVSNGPGSFTGVRIGISAAKGLSMPFSIPTLGVSTLEGIANGLSHIDGIVCSVLDARCAQVYCAIFNAKLGLISRLSEDMAISIDELVNKLLAYNDKPIFLAGDGAHLIKPLLENAQLAPPQLLYPHASSIALFAEKNFDKACDCSKLIPSYLRLPQAVRERLNNLGGSAKI